MAKKSYDDNKYYEKIGSETKDITDEIPFEIPKNWEWVRLGSVFNIILGQAPDGSSINDKEGIEFHQGKVFFGSKYLQQSNQYTTNPSKLVQKNTVLLCVRAPVGIVNITERDICIGRGLAGVANIAYISTDFTYYWLQAYKNEFISKATGTTFVAITGDVIQNQLIPLPPLSEQERIVAEIEKIFAQIEVVKSNQEELARLKDGLKNKILDLAIQGKLVEQDPNDEPASVLLEKIKAEKAELVKQGKIKKDKQESYIYKGADNRHYEKIGSETKDITEEIPFEIPESWEWCRLGNVINYGETKAVTYLECDKNQWILDLEDIEKDTSRILCKNRIKDKPFKSTKKTFIKGDVLYSKLRPYLNKVVVADEDGVCTSEILPFRIYYGIVPEYLQCCLKSHYFYEYVNQLTYGVKMPRLGTEDGKRGLIPLPPIQEQCRIIRTFSKMLEFTNQL